MNMLPLLQTQYKRHFLAAYKVELSDQSAVSSNLWFSDLPTQEGWAMWFFA